MLLVIILVFAFTAYATSATLGSPGAVFDLLVKAAADHPVDGNAGGSYLTMRSQQGGRLSAALISLLVSGNSRNLTCPHSFLFYLSISSEI